MIACGIDKTFPGKLQKWPIFVEFSLLNGGKFGRKCVFDIVVQWAMGYLFSSRDNPFWVFRHLYGKLDFGCVVEEV